MKPSIICGSVLILIIVGLGIGYLAVQIPPTTEELGNGTYMFSGTLSGDDDYRIHSLRVNSSAVSMHVALWCGSSDFDLYGALGYTPSPNNYMWRGYAAGGEDLTLNNPSEGIWHIMVQSYSGAGKYVLTIEIT
ncbi:MAG: hypothetical protein ACFFCP_16765 [Promethearchaeota archaeon]